MGTTANFRDRAKAKRVAVTDHVTWFEVPVYDLMRAKAFYDHLYGTNMETAHVGDYHMAFLPETNGIGGALVQGPGCIPNDHGTLVYLNAGGDLDGMLMRVEEAGGRVIMGRTLISHEAGSFALFIDSEGNRLALHQKPVNVRHRKAPRAAAKAPRKASARPRTRKER